MSGDWIKFETATSDKPEVWKMASNLSIDPDAVVGKLLRVWVWFDEQSISGNASSVTKSLLDRKVGVTGFCDAMIEAGWMLDDGQEIRLPNFERHNGHTAKNRAQTAKRVGKHRTRNGSSVTDALPKSNNTVTPSVTSALPEKRREEKRRENNEYSIDFEKFWSVYPPRRRTGKRATFKAWKKAIKDGVDEQLMIRAASAYAKSEKGSGEYSVSCARWLNEGMWDDDPESWGSSTSSRPQVATAETFAVTGGDYDPNYNYG